MQYRSSNARRNFFLDPMCPDRKRRSPATDSRPATLSRIVLLFILSLIAATALQTSVDAFCQKPIGRLLGTSSTINTSALGLFRPDWMRRAGRIEEKRKERRGMYESLRKRQDELGLPRTLYTSKIREVDDATPCRYRVVGSNNSNSTSGENYEDCLAIYPFVPEDEVESNDESNVLDRLCHGEIVTAVRKKSVADANAAPPRMAVVAATAIYNVQHQIRTDILWIEHDRGGWSPSIVDGVIRLIPVDDNDSDSSRNGRP